jgi:hypothetical protein
MAPEPRSADHKEAVSLLDEWRAEVGDKEIARIAAQTRRDADAGLIPGFTDRESLLAHWDELARRRG